MRQFQRVLPAAVAVVVGIVCACSSDDPARVGRPPVVSSFAPTNHQLTGFLGDTLSFQLEAIDPDRDPLAMSFAVDGGVMAHAWRWDYVIADTGLVTVRGSVSDGSYSSFIEWTVARRRPINLAPVIDAALPVEASPVMAIGDHMEFAIRATDPESKPLSYSFAVNDSLIITDRQFVYTPSSVGWKTVRAIVSDGENAAARDWSLKVTEIPDTIAPATVQILSAITGENPGEIVVEWLAVGRDDVTGLASEYQVRTAPDPILTEADWNRASQRPRVPPPIPPGGTMMMVVDGLLPARTTFVSVRAFDDFGNSSPIGSSPSVVTRGMRFSGHVVDAVTGLGIPGASVTLGTIDAFSDADGLYGFSELGPFTSAMAIRDEDTAEIGAYFDYGTTYTVKHEDVFDLFLMPDRQLDTPLYSDFLQFFRSMTDIPGNPYGTQQRRWQLPINLYVRPFERDGLDYRATVESVAAEFDALLGRQVFRLVTARPSEGVETVYQAGTVQDNYSVTEWTSDWYPRLGLIEFRTAYTPATENILARTVRHELGHVLGLAHSLDNRHLMVGGQAPAADAFAPDEVAVLRALYVIPRGWDNRKFIHE